MGKNILTKAVGYFPIWKNIRVSCDLDCDNDCRESDENTAGDIETDPQSYCDQMIDVLNIFQNSRHNLIDRHQICHIIQPLNIKAVSKTFSFFN